MPIILRVFMIIASLGTLIGIIRKVRNAKVQIEYSLFWIIFSFVLLVLSVFPEIGIFFADRLGVQSPVNFVFLVIIFVLMIHQFMNTIYISQLENKIKDLTQEIAIREYQSEKDKED